MNRKENADSGSLHSAAGENPSEAYSEGCECAGYRNKLWEKLKTGNKVYGFSVNFPAPPMIECIAPGWDYVWLDGQHGLMGYQELLSLSIAARAAQVSVIIRSPGHDFSVLGPLMDLCPQGLMVPMVNNEEEAKEIAACLQFPPKGRRSFWNTRMIQLAGDAYYKEKTTLGNKECDREMDEAERQIYELEQQQLSKAEFKKHIDTIRRVLREVKRDAAQGIINKEFVDRYIDKIFVTPEDGRLKLQIKIFTGDTTDKYLTNLKRRTGHTFKKMIESYEKSL